MWRILPHGWVVVKNRSSSSPRWHVPLAGEFLNLPLVAINEDKLANTSSSGSQPQRATRVSNLPANAMPIYLRDWCSILSVEDTDSVFLPRNHWSKGNLLVSECPCLAAIKVQIILTIEWQGRSRGTAVNPSAELLTGRMLKGVIKIKC